MAKADKKIKDVKGKTADDKKAGFFKNRSFFLSSGKYFLIAMVLIAQTLLAYTIVDKNYGQIYQFASNLTSNGSVTFQMDELIVNPAGTQGQRFLVVEISIELQRESHLEQLETHLDRIKHEMNAALSTRTVNELLQYEEREILREELIAIVNRAIGTRSVRNLYYTRYVMQ